MKWIVYILLLATFAMAKGEGACTVDSIVWTGEHSEFDELQMAGAKGAPCDAWKLLADKLVRYYENNGFIAARVQGDLSEAGGKDAGGKGAGGRHVLTLELDRGSAWVWAPAENLDSSGTKTEVFRRLAGIVEGEPVSLTDLERSERRLARIGYFDKTAPARLYRDPSRNRIFPAYSMRKANVSTAEGVLTYSSEENVWEGKLDVSLLNIAGTARDLQLEGFTGEDSRHLSGYYKEPWILGSAWNVVLRGNFDEETIDAAGDSPESDSTSGEAVERTIVGEVGITRDIGFDFSIGVYFGISEDDKHSSFEMSYVSLDRFVLPRSGWRLDASATWKMARPDSLDNFLLARAGVLAYYPLYGNFISRFSGMAGGIFPSGAALRHTDLFALGGPGDFKGMQYRMLRSRAYGLSEFALLWQDGYDLSIEAFYQPGLYRRLAPGHGWAREQNYGVGFTQYRGNWSINLYYALHNGSDFLDGIIGFGVKTLF
jgi:outer membrane protein assembly factor BamA